MITADNLAPILESAVRLAWPCLVGWALWYFRYEVIALLRKLERVKVPGGGEAWFEGESSEELSRRAPGEAAAEARSVEVVSEAQIKWEKSANLFWLGYDLATGVDRLGFGASGEGIVHSLRQSWWHAKELGLTEPSIAGKLETMKDWAKGLEEREWDGGRRDRYIRELYRVVGEIERLAIEQQPDFDPVAKE